MKDKVKKVLIAVVAFAALAVGGAAIAGATGVTGGDDDATEKPITGSALSKAKAAALDHTGGGEVTGTEAGDEEGAYEVEVTRDGKAVDVHLDSNFHVINSVNDEEKAGDR